MASEAAVRGNPALAGRSIGAMFFAGFGAIWLALWAHERFPGSMAALLVVALLAAALFSAAIRVFRRNSAGFKAMSQTPDNRRRSRIFNVINGAQWVVIFAVTFTLGQTGGQAWIVPAIILIVGVHFLPIAHLFSYRPHYVTGAALILLAVSYPFVAPDGPASAFGALAAGVILWLSAIVAISPMAERVA